MKVGILTFHSQLNYGGVLQCWALQTFLESLGHEVVVIDRRFDDIRSLHKNWLCVPMKEKCRRIAADMLGANYHSVLRRVIKTNAFIENELHLTTYNFVEWKDAPKELGVDLLVVGSDQVWHGGNWGDPRPYLMVGAPAVPSIAYAASLGMDKMPDEFTQDFATYMPHFKSVSVRETSARLLLNSYREDISVVLDPTLLVDAEEWQRLRCGSKMTGKKIVCYFVHDREETFKNTLRRFADRQGWSAEVFLNLQHRLRVPISRLWRLFGVYCECLRRGVEVKYDAGPTEFVSAFMDADAVITDSFHALMFSAIFRKNVRILAPETAGLKISFSRINDFVDEFIHGSIVQPNLEAALLSIERGEKVSFNEAALNDRIEASKQWLKDALEKCNVSCRATKEK